MNIDSLSIVESKSKVPTIEIDVDEHNTSNHRDIIEEFLISYAKNNPDAIISIYDYVTPSINFGYMSTSVYFMAVNSKQCLRNMHACLCSDINIKTRLGEYIKPSLENLQYHIEGGIAWRRDDLITFSRLDENVYSNEQSDLYADDNESIGDVQRKIEKIFNLPNGSVKLGDQGGAMRVDAKIKTLRSRWNKNN